MRGASSLCCRGEWRRDLCPAPEGAADAPSESNSSAGLNLRRRRALVITDTELKLIAAAAIIGLRMPNAASGIAAALYANAQNRLPRMVSAGCAMSNNARCRRYGTSGRQRRES